MFTQITLRKFISSLNTILDTVEIKMSSNRFGEIEPSNITSGACLKYRKALLNENSDNTVRTNDKDRIKLANNMIEYSIKNALNGASLDSVKLANIIWKNQNASNNEKQIINAQFNH